MTPIFLKSSSPFSHDHLGDQIRDHQQQHLKLFISPYNEGSSSLVSPSPTFFDSNSHQYQSTGVGQTHDQQRDQNDVIDVVSASQKTSTNYQDTIIIDGNYNMNNNNTSGGGSVKYWMSSKMRLIQKMTNPETPAETVTTSLSSSIGQQKREKSSHKIANSPKQDKSQITFSFSHTNTPGGGLRVCSDCNTTTTPLWRSGPRGPKSLCNACGIRQRKARRAMAEAAAGGRDSEANGSDITANNNGGSMKSIYNYKTHVTKEKKARVNHGNIAHYKSKLKLKIVDTAATTKDNNKSQMHNNKNDMNDNNKFCFGDFSFGLNDKNCSAFSGVFPQDVAEAAMLLMELSCHGLVHS